MSYYVAQIKGLKDMRSIRGPFADRQEANDAAIALIGGDSCGTHVDSSKLGDWYSLHGANIDMGFVDGPYQDAARAEAERIRNWTEYDAECCGDRGRIGTVIARHDDVVLLECVE